MRSGMLLALMPVLMWGQGTAPAPKPAPASTPTGHKSAAAPRNPDVENVIQLVQSGMSEAIIIRQLRTQGKAVKLSSADLVRLQKAKVSENIIDAMMGPSAASVAVSPPAATSTPAATPSPVATPTQTGWRRAEDASDPRITPSSTSAPIPSRPSAATRRRVIIDEFDYSAVVNQVQTIFGTQKDIGKGIRAMLIKRVAESNQMIVVERQKIDMVQREQDRNVGTRVKQGTGGRVGRISGADAILMGDIVIFGRDDKRTKIGGLAGRAGLGAGALGSLMSQERAVVAINYRLVDAETSEVLATGEKRGESVRKSRGLGGLAGAVGQGVAGISVDMTSSNFAETIIGEATMDCVNQLTGVLDQQVPRLEGKKVEVEAFIVDVNGSNVMIGAGSDEGVNVGEVFDVLRIVREVKDPVTKDVIDRVTEPVGTLTIFSVRNRSAIGTYTGGPVQAGTSFQARKRIQ